jgi:tetratricopeptide (TPR) repeat protein
VAQARLRFQRGRPQEAVPFAERAQRTAPTDPEIRLLLINTLAAAGQRAAAIDKAQVAAHDWPRRSEFHLQLGRLQIADGRREEGVRSLSTALQLDPDSIAALEVLTDEELREGRGQSAIARLDERLRKQPDSQQLLLILAAAQATLGQNDKAEATFRSVVQRSPSGSAGLASLGRFYAQRGRLDEARQVFERLESTRRDGRAGDASGSATMLGLIFEEQAQTADAERAFERALAANPRDGIAANNLAWLYQQQGRLDEALRWAIVANEQLRRVETRDTLGWIRVQRGEYREALSMLVSAVQAKPDNPVYRYHIAVAYSKTGSVSQARSELKQALASNATFAGRDEAARLLTELDTTAKARR